VCRSKHPIPRFGNDEEEQPHQYLSSAVRCVGERVGLLDEPAELLDEQAQALVQEMEWGAYARQLQGWQASFDFI
jgi:hypothetical protein